MGKITEEEMARLTDDERAALEGDTDVMSVEEIKAAEEAAAKAAADAAMTDEERAAKKAEDDKIEEEAKAKAQADAEKAAAEQAAKEAEDKRKADDAAAAEAAEKAKAAAAVAPAAPDPAFVLKEQSAKTAEATAALDAKLEEGEITLAEYNKQLRDLLYADINEQVLKGAAEKSWKDSQRAFYEQNPEYSGAPIALEGDTPEVAAARARAMNLTLVDAVNTILATDESKKMTDAQIFALAKTRCDGVYKPRQPKGSPSEEAAAKAAAEAAAKKKALDDAKAAELAKATGVKTLKDVPAADSSMADDKFDMIDKLEGDAFQNAIARLSDADRAAYAARP